MPLLAARWVSLPAAISASLAISVPLAACTPACAAAVGSRSRKDEVVGFRVVGSSVEGLGVVVVNLMFCWKVGFGEVFDFGGKSRLVKL